MIISYEDIRRNLGHIEGFGHDKNDTLHVIQKPIIKATFGDVFDGDMKFNIVILYKCTNVENDDIEVAIPIFSFNEKPTSKLIKNKASAKVSIISINKEELSWLSTSIYVDSTIVRIYKLENMVFMNKYIFGTPWYDIMSECDVEVDIKDNE